MFSICPHNHPGYNSQDFCYTDNPKEKQKKNPDNMIKIKGVLTSVNTVE